MFRVFYNAALCIFVILWLPKWLWEMLRHQKHRFSFAEKLGFKLPTFPTTQELRIWVHSISVGETKAVASLITELRKKYPTISIVLSTVTETGYEEAKRSIPKADQYFFLPLDFSWTIRRLIQRMKPDLLVLVEGDFWFNFIDLAPRVILVNGKISERSTSSFLKVPFFSRPFFQKIELLCVQSSTYADRFVRLGVNPKRMTVTGNLKFDQEFLPIDKNQWRAHLGLTSTNQVITLGSTHDQEEELLLNALEPLFKKFPDLKILLVPRHPERFMEVAKLLEKKQIEFSKYSDPLKKRDQRVILVDAMGVLSSCYQLSELAIVGGSFIKRVGGHNIFEPAALGIPVLFGPSMYSQKDLVTLVVDAGAGIQVSLENLAKVVEELLLNPSQQMHQAGLRLAHEVHGSTQRTLHCLETTLLKK